MKVLSYIVSPEFIYMWIRVATPIIFSSLGGVICSRAGVVNLGLEGIMLISALAGVLGSAFGGSLFWGIVAGMAAAAIRNIITPWIISTTSRPTSLLRAMISAPTFR